MLLPKSSIFNALEMKTYSPILYFALLISIFWGSNSSIFAQSLSEKALIRGIRETKNIDDKILRMIRLGEYYADNNLLKANGLRKKINYLAKQKKTKKKVDVDLFNAKIFKLQRNSDSFKLHILPYRNANLTGYSKQKQFEILQNLGYHYLTRANTDTADMYLKNALKIVEELKNYSGICRTYCYLSFNEMQQYKKEEALAYTDLAMDAANKSKKRIDFAFSYLFQSFAHNYFGQPDIALSKELSAYSYARNAQNFPIMALVCIQIGGKQVDIQNIKEAEYYYDLGLKYATEYGDLRLQGIALFSQANVKRIQKKLEEAHSLNLKSLAILKKTAIKHDLGNAELNFARIYIDKKAYAEALIHLNKAIAYHKISNNQIKIKEVYQYKGIVYKSRKQYNQALYFFINSIDTNNLNSLMDKSFEVYQMIAEIYKAQGNHKKALEYLDAFVKLSQKSKGNQAARSIAELNELYRSEQRDKLILKQNNILEKQKRERELTKTKLENVSLRYNLQTYVIIAFVIILILATVIGIYRNRQTAIQQKRREAEMSQVLLRTQMNPHFIFNAMSVIQSYIFENDIKNSSKFLVNFSRLIRLILENSPKAFINLETEVEILQKYLETQKIRFEDRFDFEIICPEELFFDNVQIPPMITQPFVENSIEHGQLHTLPNGKIKIQFSKQSNMLNIRIEDNGIGRAKSEELKIGKDHKSMALTITRKRIKMINEKYNAAGYLLMTDLDEENHLGTKVLISLPYVNKQNITT
jgi:tetratricopeptide (TPR) repeat protein